MPTGYTYKLMEQGQSFDDFVLTCARGIDYFVDMREEDLSVMPKTKGTDAALLEKISEAESEIKEYESMTEARWEEMFLREQKDSFSTLTKSIDSQQRENERLEEMERRVKQWQAPTFKHETLKSFMLEQLAISKHDLSYLRSCIENLKGKTLEQYRKEKMDELRWYLQSRQKDLARESHNTNERNAWTRQLYESLNQNAPA